MISNRIKRLVSGIKPTGKLHLGNYLGAIKNWVELQKQYQCFYFIADLHALTMENKQKELNQDIHNLMVDLLALGLDPNQAIIFRQSEVVGHTELAWIFNCLTPVAELERMTQFKDQAKNNPQNVNAGLLTYPALQAADILLYQGEVVPVGEDQVQHLELSRIISRKFNNRYHKHFPEVKPILSPTPRVMALNYPDKKMSKSLGETSYLALRDNDKLINQKIKKAVTTDQGVKNLLELYSYFGDPTEAEKMTKDFKNKSLMNVELKEKLSQVIIDFLKPIQEKINYYDDQPKEVMKIFQIGAQQAQKIADKNLAEIKKIIGLN